MRRLAVGSLEPLPHRVFAVEEAPQAFRFMAQARHTGKVVLQLDGRLTELWDAPVHTPALRWGA